MDNRQSERQAHHGVSMIDREWLNSDAYQIRFDRPREFRIVAGQKLLVSLDGVQREYTIIDSSSTDLTLLIKHISDGELSDKLARIEPGGRLYISDPCGYFVHRPGRAVFVATGTGVAPFIAYVRNGVTGFILLHGVRCSQDLYFRGEFEKAALSYTPCLSSPLEKKGDEGVFVGRVNHYLQRVLPSGEYDFYLCGNGEMVNDSVAVIDHRFPGSRIFTEKFF